MQTVDGNLPRRDKAVRLVRALGIEEADFDTEARLAISLPEDLQADLVWLESRCAILATIRLMPAEETNAAVLAELLTANSGWTADAGCIFSIPPGSGALCLTTSFAVDSCSESEFQTAFTRFAQSASLIREQVEEIADSADEGEGHD